MHHFRRTMEYQNEKEFEQLLKLFKLNKPRYVLEIGSMFGDTLHEWIKYSDEGATIVSIDLALPEIDSRHLQQKHFHDVLSRQWGDEFNKKVHVFPTDSHSLITYNQVKDLFPNGIDFLFIDGDHSYDGVKQDYMMYSQLVNKNESIPSIIAFHDVCGIEGCIKFWEEIKSHSFINDLISESKDGWGIGVMYV